MVVDRATCRPVAGAAVRVDVHTRRIPASGEGRPELHHLREVAATTPADGTYRFELSAEEQVDRALGLTVFVDHPGYVHWYGSVDYRGALREIEAGDRPFFERVELAPGVPVEGLVLDPDGAPAAGVKITGYTDLLTEPGPPRDGNFVETRADAVGRFRLPLHPTGRAFFSVLPVEFEPVLVPLKADRRGDVGTIRLGRGVRIRGRILDAEGRPAAGVAVEAYPTASSRRTPQTEAVDGIPYGVGDNISRAAVTGADGSFALAALPPGEVEVRPVVAAQDPATRRGVDEARSRPLPVAFLGRKVTLAAGGDPEAVEIRAVPSVTVRAQFFDGRGEPRRGWEIDLYGKVDGQYWSSSSEPSKTGALAILAPKGLTDAVLDVTGHESEVVSLRLAPGGLIIGDSEVRLGTLDADRDGIEIIVGEAPTLFIRATTRDGRPVPGAKVEVKPVPRPGGALGRLGGLLAGRREGADVWVEGPQADGRFRTAHLSPDVEIEVTASADGFAPATCKRSLPEGKVEEVSLTLEPLGEARPAAPPDPGAAAAGDREWSGRVVDAGSGQPIAGARVRVIVGYNGATVDDPRGKPRVVEQVTPADGSYRFAVRPAEAADPSLAVGLIVEEAEHVEYNRVFSYEMSLKLLAEEGRRPTFEAVALRAAKVVTMQVLTPDGTPAAGVEVRGITERAIDPKDRETARPTARTDAQGRFRMPLHPEGPATLRVVPDEFEPATVRVAMQQVGDLGTLRLGRGARIAGTVVDADGRPLGGVAVRATRPLRGRHFGGDGVAAFADAPDDRRGTTRDDGSFALAPLPPGTYEVQVGGMVSWDEPTPTAPLARACVPPHSIELEPGRDPAPLAIRAVPHAIVAVRLIDGPGKAVAAPRSIQVRGDHDGTAWQVGLTGSAAGDYRAVVPRGSSVVEVNAMPSGEVAATHRLLLARDLPPAAAAEFREAVAGRGDPDRPHLALGAAPMLRGRSVRFGPLDGDAYVEFTQVLAPMLTIRPVDAAGRPLGAARVAVNYVGHQDPDEVRYDLDGTIADVFLQKSTPGGAWTTAGLFPDREVEVTATAVGCRPASRRMALPSGLAETVTLTLEPE